jgi:hypothetical protein
MSTRKSCTQCGRDCYSPNGICRDCQFEDKQQCFIANYRKCGTLGKAAIETGVKRQAVYYWMEAHPQFREFYEKELKPDRIDELMSCVYRAAMGEKGLTHIQLKAAIFLLKSLDPATFAENYQANRDFGGEPVKVEFVVENPRDGNIKPAVIGQPALEGGAGHPNLLGQSSG